jgi:hypothetical protein
MFVYFSIPMIFVILGLVIWVAASKPKVSEFGRLVLLAGLIGLCWSLSGHYFPLRR